MAHGHHQHHAAEKDLLQLSGKANGLATVLLIVGIVAVLASLGVSMSSGGLKRFYHAYMTGYAYVFSIAFGGLFMLLIHYLVRAGWSVAVRRIPEALAGTIPIMGLLAIPLVVCAWSGKGDVYPWAQAKPAHPTGSWVHTIEESTAVGPKSAHHGEAADSHSDDYHAKPAHSAAHGSHDDGHAAAPGAKPVSALTMGKMVWLNPAFWTGRIIFYFVFFSLVALYFIRKSRGQDTTGDHTVTERLNLAAAPLTLLTFVLFTFAAFDLFMSLDPDWYSTIFGIYYFAGSIDAMVATTIIIAAVLQRAGYLQHSISKEHYHDLGKWLFAFTFFWGYIAFSQYMLIWYANIPETTYWFAKRGATTNPQQMQLLGGWTVWTLALLFGRLLIPFAGLLSRHVKRNNASLIFWAVWILVFHAVDMVWVVMPEYELGFTFGLPEVASLLGLIGIFTGSVVWRLTRSPLRPVKDPRLPESLAFQNI
ncbi:MAG TPA: hypothetical protein PLD59_12630 [Tepidisphaeraceae bacterium]|nr:hypothetical protein [Tepidisphaeraceae bacterium]